MNFQCTRKKFDSWSHPKKCPCCQVICRWYRVGQLGDLRLFEIDIFDTDDQMIKTIFIFILNDTSPNSERSCFSLVEISSILVFCEFLLAARVKTSSKEQPPSKTNSLKLNMLLISTKEKQDPAEFSGESSRLKRLSYSRVPRLGPPIWVYYLNDPTPGP